MSSRISGSANNGPSGYGLGSGPGGDADRLEALGLRVLRRHFTYWRGAPLRAALEAAGFSIDSVEHPRGTTDDWLQVLARA